ncbi:MAG: hypothetical protein HY070_05110 [Chloroflexi bacterium]|nr:hypothetical protein [Chloroflexota bacterium]
MANRRVFHFVERGRGKLNRQSPLANFDPAKLAYYEKENYVAYYQRDWLKLLRVSVGMVKEGFSLSLWQAINAASLVARAEIAFAPFPNNDVPRAKAIMRDFYRYINRVHHLNLDVARAADVDVNWWIVHRKLFANPQNQELVEALKNYYALAYNAQPELLSQAAQHRALGMLYSDQWVNAGKPMPSELLVKEEEELRAGYIALRAALDSG